MTDPSPWSRLIFPGFHLGKDSPVKAEKLARAGVGGFCLYGGSAVETASLTARLQKIAEGRLVFCADYEDGLASQCPDGTALVSNMGLGAAGSAALAFAKGRITGLESRAAGVRWVLAPVVDLAVRSENPIVNIRAFSSNPALTARLARAYLQGLKSAGASGCLKHFPGHGDTAKDSHLELPKVLAGRETLLRRDLAPFRALARSAASVMLAHLSVPALSREDPISSLSPRIIALLRQTLGFKGLIVTDALDMGAAAGQREPGLAALAAGADVLLVPADPWALMRGLNEGMSRRPELEGLARTALRRIDGAFGRPEKIRSAAEIRTALKRVGCAAHKKSAAAMAQAAITAVGRSPELGRKIRYWEPDEISPARWKGRTFVGALRAAGLRVLAGPRVEKDETLLVASFLSPRAYTGRIAYPSSQARAVARIAARAKTAVLISFGSPFVFAQFRLPGLCTFSKSAESQEAAALALLGKSLAPGRMPVRLSQDQR